MRKAARLAPLALALPLTLPFVGTAYAATGSASAVLSPVPLNGSHATGTAMVTVNGTHLDVTLDVHDILKDQPHAAHIHFGQDAQHECPTAEADTNHDGYLNTSEGGPAYGPVTVSLTTTGDTSPKSALAVDRFSTAPAGTITYARGGIDVAPEIAQAILDGQAVVVVHGNDYNGNGKYDGSAKSDLDPSLPTEATDPNVCGVLTAAPAGGAATGLGGGAQPSRALLGLAGGLLLAGAGVGSRALRRTGA
jgi:hypothetical protein